MTGQPRGVVPTSILIKQFLYDRRRKDENEKQMY